MTVNEQNRSLWGWLSTFSIEPLMIDSAFSVDAFLKAARAPTSCTGLRWANATSGIQPKRKTRGKPPHFGVSPILSEAHGTTSAALVAF